MVKEKQIGKVSGYFSKVGVAAIVLSGGLKKGDKVHIRGATTDFEVAIKGIQIERESVAVFVLLSLNSDVTQKIIQLANQGIDSVLVVFDPRSFAAVLDKNIGDFYNVFSQLMNGEASYLTGEGIRVYMVKHGDSIPDALSRPHMFLSS